MNRLSIIAYLDGRPGHEKQTLAVIQALENLTPTATETITIRHHSLAAAIPAAALLSFKRQRAQVGQTSELLIGSGRRTHPALIMAKYRRGRRAAAVCCMSPGRLLRPAFDLCLVPDHDDLAEAENIFRTNGPPCLTADGKSAESGRSLILIGGLDPKSHHWNSALVRNQVASLLDKAPERLWTISSSPRTPPETSNALADLAATHRHTSFHHSEETGKGWLEEQYRQNREVWVTADSISMVYEALSAGCRVGVLPVRWRRPGNKFQRALDRLRHLNLIVYADQWSTGTPLPETGSTLNEARSCAREILRRWWPERLTVAESVDSAKDA